MKKLILILFLSSMILIGGCSYKIPEINNVGVTYIVSGGHVPEQYKDWHDILRVVDRNVIRDYKFDKQETKEIKLSKQEAFEFRKLILESKVDRFNDDYNCFNMPNVSCIVDAPGHKIDFFINGDIYKSISMDTPENAPKELKDIINKLNEFKERIEDKEIESQYKILTDDDIKVELKKLEKINVVPSNRFINKDHYPKVLGVYSKNGLVLVEIYFCSDVCPLYGGVGIYYQNISTKEECAKINGKDVIDPAWGGYRGCTPKLE